MVEGHMKCVNYYCERELQEWQIKKIVPHRYNKHRLCTICKKLGNHRKVDFITCEQCGKKIERTEHRLRCAFHKIENNRIASLKHYHKNKVLKI